MHTIHQNQLHQLTALRFFAAFLVLLYHLSFLKDTDNILSGAATTVFSEGFSGVAFFFVLSGFILSHTYSRKLSLGEVSRRKFLFLRFARIYPLHFLTAAPFIIYSLYEKGASDISRVAANITLLHSWIPYGAFYFSFNLVSWSLSNELFFYSSFLFLTTLSTKLLGKTALAWFITIAFTAFICILLGYSSWESSRVHYLAYISPVTRLLDFMAGMLIYRICVDRPSRGESVHEVFSLALLFCAMYLSSKHQLPDVLRSQLLYLPIMIYVVWSFSGGHGIVSQAVRRPAFILLGEASFALYMIHQPIIHQGFSAYNKFQPPFGHVTLAAILVVVSVIASIVVYIYVERPIHNGLRKKIGKMT